MKRALILMALLGGTLSCDYFAGDPSTTTEFRDAMLARWAAPGVTFLGQYGGGPIVAAEETSDGVWSVDYPLESGDTVTASLRFTEVDAYLIFPFEEFARLVDERARARDRMSGLSAEAWRLITGGQNDGIGRMQIEVQRPEASGTERLTLYALRRTGETPSWEFLSERRSLTNAFAAVDGLYEELMRSDDRVMDCAQGTDPMSDRPRFLACTEEVLIEDYDLGVEGGS